MYLSDNEIDIAICEGRLVIDPFTEGSINPNSIDLRLGSTYTIPRKGAYFRIDDPNGWRNTPGLVQYHEEYILEPGAFVLGTTEELVEFVWGDTLHISRDTTGIPKGENGDYDLWGQVHGKSTFGRLGLMVHVTAGIIDTGFRGRITLELKNVGTHPLTLVSGVPICQLTVAKCGRVRKPYQGKYQDQETATWAR